MLDLSQQTLHELEAKCIKEQPPAAMAACPLHVDCRGICSAIAAADFNTARELFEKSSVFPKITSCLCEGPCQNACLRHPLGGALHLQQLEMAAVTYGTLRPKRQFLPKKAEKIAVIGAGLTGLSAALELGKKGYAVAVFEEAPLPGGWLLNNRKLPASILEEELKKLSQYKIEIHTCHKVTSIEAFKKEFQSIFIAWGKKETPISVHPLTRFWKDSVFAGGDAIRSEHGSVPESIADGKSSAISIDRFLKKVSLEAGREDEFSSCTNLAAMPPDKTTCFLSHTQVSYAVSCVLINNSLLKICFNTKSNTGNTLLFSIEYACNSMQQCSQYNHRCRCCLSIQSGQQQSCLPKIRNRTHYFSDKISIRDRIPILCGIGIPFCNKFPHQHTIFHNSVRNNRIGISAPVKSNDFLFFHLFRRTGLDI